MAKRLDFFLKKLLYLVACCLNYLPYEIKYWHLSQLPDQLFHYLKLRDQEIGEFYVAREQRAIILKLKSCERVGRLNRRLKLSVLPA